MQRVDLQSDLDAIDERFIDAVKTVSGLSNVLVLDTFLGVDRETGAYDEHAPVDRREADIYIEWRRWLGRYGLEVRLYGPKPLREPMSEAEFVRRLAAELARPLVISDCDVNPWSYLRSDPGGAIHHVFTLTDDEDGNPSFDLACDLEPSDQAFLPSTKLFSAREELPRKPADAPDHMPHAIRRFCQTDNADEKLCENFWGPCPNLRRCAR